MNELEKVSTYTHQMFGELRVIEKEGELWFVAKDVATMLGYAEPGLAVRTHCKGGAKHTIPTKGGTQQMTIIPERDIYRLIMRSKLKEAEKFEDWVVGEVLPALRKHGAYLTPDKIEEVLLNPDMIIRLATDLKIERQKRKDAEVKQVAAETTVKKLVHNSSTYTAQVLAKECGFGSAQEMNKYLKMKGVIYKAWKEKSGVWLATAAYARMGLMKGKDVFVKKGEKEIKVYMSEWTSKGRLYVLDLVSSDEELLRYFREVAKKNYQKAYKKLSKQNPPSLEEVSQLTVDI